jgi:hypothetical protein
MQPWSERLEKGDCFMPAEGIEKLAVGPGRDY